MGKSAKIIFKVIGVVVCSLFIIGFGLLKAKAVEPVSDRQIILYLHWENGEVSLTNVKVRSVPYRPPRGGYAGDWKLEVLSKKNKLLHEMRFLDPTMIFWDKVDPETGKIIDGGMEYQDTVDFIIVVPYNAEARRLKVYKQKVLDTPTPKTIDQLISTIQFPPIENWEVIPSKGAPK
jgi:hypothetical protein